MPLPTHEEIDGIIEGQCSGEYIGTLETTAKNSQKRWAEERQRRLDDNRTNVEAGQKVRFLGYHSKTGFCHNQLGYDCRVLGIGEKVRVLLINDQEEALLNFDEFMVYRGRGNTFRA